VDDIPGALKWVWRKLTGHKSEVQTDLNIAIK
jgi:hypothetical protein